MASLVSKKVIVLKPENVAQLVFFIRGEKVMLDADLAMLYGVEPRVLNQAVARNRKRFPADFVFQLSAREYDALTSQIVISDKDDARAASALESQIVISKKGRGGPAIKRGVAPTELYALTNPKCRRSLLTDHSSLTCRAVAVRAGCRRRRITDHDILLFPLTLRPASITALKFEVTYNKGKIKNGGTGLPPYLKGKL